MSERQANVTQGETEGPEQEPREAGAADPAVRDPRPDGPMDQRGDAGAAEFGDYPDSAGRGGEELEEGSPT